ncbi:TPM domain-containing protein [Dinghuibacter silviterrae]|uniref:TLP18.3/Psb32/MOLO-1 phosphatase superfamily protein n=1 Tax=Dinghuibacter silviterrae TaxID=1539049 RepID=A0A4V3GKS3_9BACT|nr:TPM domain-containing protein [Dinghuibacter silviterrae]TDW96762.1 TLP18.3/Psb32/MOLO-1 phosphatase superfamily protein [Dinghuibacter silviterrae]
MQPIIKISLIGLLFAQVCFTASAQEKDDVIIAQAPGGFSLHGRVYHKHFKDEVPPASGYVTDWENLFTDAQEAHIDSMVADFSRQTGIQIAVVTVDSSMSSKDGFDSVILRLGNTWGVGQDSSKGIVVGISNSLGIMRIQNGVGVAATLSDADTQQIVDAAFLPEFEKGDYYLGTLIGLAAIMQKLQGVSR